MSPAALALALALSQASGASARLPPAPVQLWKVAWTRPLVPHSLLEYKPREPGGAAIDPQRGNVVLGARDGILRALSDKGRVLWELKAGGPFEAAPRIEGDTVYAGCDDGKLYAVEAGTGKLRWSYDAQEELGTTPAVANGVVYVASLQDTLFALDAATGAFKWHHRREGKEGFSIRGAGAAAVSNGLVYGVYSDGYVAALDAATGAPRWERRVAPSGDFLDIDSTPQVEGGRVYVAAWSGAVYALDAATGEAVWEAKVAAPLQLALLQGRLVVVSATRVLALSPRDGKIFWNAPLEGEPAGEPVLASGAVAVPVGSAVRWLDPTTGRLVRAFDPGTGVTARLAVRAGRAYALSNGGELVALDLR
ncbi:MAG TPA: PQQ-binding-like beta-propeller repeat protein [Anaeromyxobacteraceae bacterium]|jgi:outer membrane protein assembly factor BamB|nr:PQQ-binding-like beta-propeller repeat protein [Anaeromyxobacteraceae bacterium]